MTQPRSSRHLRLLTTLARRFRQQLGGDVAGRCLGTSLDFASAAQRAHGLLPDLVRWHVQGDPEYLDHWAVRLDAGRVIDLTRAQVDGQTRPVCALASYPAHYGQPRVYPASLLLPAYRRFEGQSIPALHDTEGAADGVQRLRNRLLWAIGCALLGHDAQQALRQRDPRVLAVAVDEFARFVAGFGVAALRHLLVQRRRQLLQRLQLA